MSPLDVIGIYNSIQCEKTSLIMGTVSIQNLSDLSSVYIGLDIWMGAGFCLLSFKIHLST